MPPFSTKKAGRDRCICRVATRRDGRAAHDAERIGKPADAADGLVEEPGHADAAGAADDDPGTSAVGGRVERDGEPRQLALATDEALAHVPRGHRGHRATRRAARVAR